MFTKSNLTLLFLVLLVYIAIGDKVLPGAIGAPSRQIRETANGALLSLFPDWQPKTNPYGRTERAIDQETQGR